VFQNDYSILNDETDLKHMEIVLKCIKVTFLINHKFPKQRIHEFILKNDRCLTEESSYTDLEHIHAIELFTLVK